MKKDDENDNNINKSKVQNEEKDASICSLKQPSLRQISNSLTSRSNKLLNRHESADPKISQDPNASFTCSRILLETSMQQSERGISNTKANSGSKNVNVSLQNTNRRL